MVRQFVLKRDPSAESISLSIDYRSELNAQQLRAVTFGRGAALVVAGAGTGKTRTLVYRVAYLVETGVPPEEIVLLTFTRRSAREMISRASALLDGRCQHVMGGTFHSFCLNILHKYGMSIGFPGNFTILDSADAADVIDLLRSEIRIQVNKKRFPRKRTLQAIISGVRNQGIPVLEYVENRYPQFLEYVEMISDLAAEYDRYKFNHGLMDYDDLLSQTLFLFEEHDNVRKSVAGRCRYVLVDEYQDTNRAQASIVRALASVNGNLMVVGDDAQSIYRFRGADFKNIMRFPEQFPDTVVLKLEQNYRSTQGILDLANHIITTARQKFEKHLFTDLKTGENPVLIRAPDTRSESRFVSQMILERRESGVELSDMAVLFRSGFNSYDLEIELNRCGIPFVKYGGLKLSEAAHIKDVLAHLKVVENPRDGVAWNRILLLIEGIGPQTARNIREWIDEQADRQADNVASSQASSQADGQARTPFSIDEPRFSPGYVEKVRVLLDMLRSLHTNPNMSVTDQVETVLAYYEPLLHRIYYEDYPKRTQDLEHFATLAESFTDRAALLASLALDPIELTAIDIEPMKDDEPPLVLSTIHSAKGLEFNSVFLIQAMEGVLPSAYSVGDHDAEDEELRLLYVAVTRAARRLYISYPGVKYNRSAGQYFAKPSRFLVDIPEKLLESGSLVEQEQQLLQPARDELEAHRSETETT